MDLQQAIYTRRAVRDFTNDAVDQTTICQLIEAAIQAPSAVNEQPWVFSVVRNKAVLARISKQSKSYMLQKPPAGISSHHLQELLSKPDFDIFYNAPALIVISALTENQWTIENCSLAAENLMLAACAAGLGTCWIGFAQTWLNTTEGKATLQVPAAYVPVAPIILGHPNVMPPPVPRKQPEIRWIG